MPGRCALAASQVPSAAAGDKPVEALLVLGYNEKLFPI